MSQSQPPMVPYSAGIVILNWLKRNRRIIFFLFLGAFIIFLGSSLSSIVNPVLLAFMLAYIINPFVNFLERRNINRTTVITSIIIFFYWFVVVFSVFVVSATITKVDMFMEALVSEDYKDYTNNEIVDRNLYAEDLNENGVFDPETETILRADDDSVFEETAPKEFEVYENVKGFFQPTGKIIPADPSKKYVFAEFVDQNNNKHFDEGLIYKIRKFVVETWNKTHYEHQQYILDSIDSLEEELLSKDNSKEIVKTGFNVFVGFMKFIGGSISNLLWFTLMLMLVPIYMFYFLKGMNGIRDVLLDYIPVKNRQRILDVLFEIHATIGAFFRGRLIVSVIVAVLTVIGLMLVGVPFATPIGLIHGITIIVPFASTVLVMIPTLLLTYITYDPAIYNVPSLWFTLMLVLLIFGIIQWGEQLFLTPLLLSKEVELHPMVVIVSIFAGGFLLGLFGIIIAVPVASVIKIVSREFLLPKLRSISQSP